MANGICQDCGHRSFSHFAHFNKYVLNPIQRDGYSGDGRRAMFKLKNDVLDKCKHSYIFCFLLLAKISHRYLCKFHRLTSTDKGDEGSRPGVTAPSCYVEEYPTSSH